VAGPRLSLCQGRRAGQKGGRGRGRLEEQTAELLDVPLDTRQELVELPLLEAFGRIEGLEGRRGPGQGVGADRQLTAPERVSLAPEGAQVPGRESRGEGRVSAPGFAHEYA
jgi:hypothetical protein